MRSLSFLLVIFASICFAKKEELGDLAELLKDPSFSDKLIIELEKRLSKISPDAGVCKYATNHSTIIKTQASIDNGATFIGSPQGVINKDICKQKCCDDRNCTVAVVKETEGACYLFNCGSPNKCLFSAHPEFSIVSIKGQHVGLSASSKKEQESHADALEMLVTTKQPSTAKPTPQPVKTAAPLFGACNDAKDCMGSYTTCLTNLCLCQKGYHEQDGMCQKQKSDHEEEKASQSSGAKNKGEVDSEKNVQEVKTSKPVESSSTEKEPEKATSTKSYEKTDSPKSKPASKDTDTSSKSNSSSESEEKGKSESTEASGKGSEESSSEEGSSKKSSEESQGQDVGQVAKVIHNRVLNDEAAEKKGVDYKPETSQGAIIALALGLAITAMLLMFVGCRLRTVKHRLRRGRPMQTNEADYLINGMYL